jgi:hypothetical protein
MKRKEMSLLSREDLRQLRWQLLASQAKNKTEESRICYTLKNVNKELAVRAQTIVKNESRET